MVLQWATKDPSANLDYSIDWVNKLNSTETISTSAWTVPSGLAAGNESISGDTTTIYLSGGTAGAVYSITNRIVTDESRTLELDVRLVVREKYFS